MTAGGVSKQWQQWQSPVAAGNDSGFDGDVREWRRWGGGKQGCCWW